MAIAVYAISVYIYCNESLPFRSCPRDLSSEVLADDHKRWLRSNIFLIIYIPRSHLLKNKI